MEAKKKILELVFFYVLKIYFFKNWFLFYFFVLQIIIIIIFRSFWCTDVKNIFFLNFDTDGSYRYCQSMMISFIRWHMHTTRQPLFLCSLTSPWYIFFKFGSSSFNYFRSIKFEFYFAKPSINRSLEFFLDTTGFPYLGNSRDSHI
jgi:hypothetical protein